MARSALFDKYDQIAGGIAHLNGLRDAVVKKIERLEKAVKSLQSNKSMTEVALERIINIEIDTSTWRGTEKDTFVDQKHSYEDNVTEFTTDIERACGEIEEKIKELQEELATLDSQIAHMESAKEDVLSQIHSGSDK